MVELPDRRSWSAEQLEVVWLPRYSPECNPSEFLNNHVKHNLKNESLPNDTADFRATLESILESFSGFSNRIKGYFRQSNITEMFA